MSCPICQGTTYSYLFRQLPQCEQASVVTCGRCAHLYTLVEGVLDIGQLYDDEVYRVVDNRNSIFDKVLDWEYGRFLRQLRRLRPHRGDLLDFGCGKGKLGWLAQREGWNVKCVETAPQRAAYARDVYHLDVDSRFYERGRIFDTQFDVITLFHVLEHLPYPHALLHELVSSNLRPDGIIVIEVPNSVSWQARWAKSHWMHLDVPRHLQHFSPHRLSQMMGDIGFCAIKTTYSSVHLGVLGMMDSLLKLFGYDGRIIVDLKGRKSAKMMAQVALALPLAFPVEVIASMLSRGGVVRMYLVRR